MSVYFVNPNGGKEPMAPDELELQLSDLEDLFEDIVALVHDPEISDIELRQQLRDLLEGDDDGE